MKVLPNACWATNLKDLLIGTLKMNINIEFTCAAHKESFLDFFYQKSVDMLIFAWTKRLNNILNGADLKGTDEENLMLPIKRQEYKLYIDKISFNRRR